MSATPTQMPISIKFVEWGLNCGRRTGSSVGTDTGEGVETVNAGAAVLTRLITTLIDFTVTQMSCIPGLATTDVAVSTVLTGAMNARHTHTVVWVHFAASTIVS